MSAPHALYRFYDETSQLLYVGISVNPGARFAQHRSDKPWWGDVVDIKVQALPSREAALAAEREAIKNERPLHNVIHAEQTMWRPDAPYNDSYTVIDYAAIEAVLLAVCDDPEIAKYAANGLWWAAAAQHTEYSMAVLERLPPDLAIEKAKMASWEQAQKIVTAVASQYTPAAKQGGDDDQ